MNKLLIVGNIGTEIKVTQTSSGKSVAKFSVAVNKSYTDKRSGEKKESTDWFNVVAWDRKAEWAQANLKKGMRVFVEGEVKTGEYEKDGVKHKTWDVNVEKMYPIASTAKKESSVASSMAEEGEEDNLPF